MSWIRVLTLNAHQGFRAWRRQGRAAAHPRRTASLGRGDRFPAGSWRCRRRGPRRPCSTRCSRMGYGRNMLMAGMPWSPGGITAMRSCRSTRSPRGRTSTHRWALAEPRGFLHAVIALPQGRGALHAICVHLALREAHRRIQVARLLELVAGEIPRSAPLVLAGDFNDWRGHSHRLLLRGGEFTEVHDAAGGRPARTFPARAPLLRLDRIYVRNLEHRPFDMRAREWANLSDHVPLAAELMPPQP